MIILTGGAGFIGSCFLWKLNQLGITDIMVVDNLDFSEKWKNLLGKKFSDYLQKEEFHKLLLSGKLPKVKKVIHIGACSSTTLCDGDYFIKNNFEFSKDLAKWSIKNKTNFFYASSAATYGDGLNGYDDEHSKVYNLRPLNVYGFSKQIFDLWILQNGLADKTTGFKFFNVFGPNEYHKGDMRSVVCKMFPDAKDKGVMHLFKSYKKKYSDGEQLRDFVYIKDVVEIMNFFFQNPSKTGIYNIGTGKARSWNDIAKAVFSALGKTPKIEYVEMPENIKERYQYFTQANMDKINAAGCKHKFMTLEESVRDYAKYLLNNTYL